MGSKGSRGELRHPAGSPRGRGDIRSCPVFLSGQAGPALHRPGLAGLSGGFQMRAGPGLVAFLGGLSLNRIFCFLRKSPKYET